MNEQGNYLPPDNYQEDRKEKVAYRTSPTNIGLALLAVASSYDLKWEDANFVLNLYEKMFPSIEKLPKWNGHLYNWYNIQTLTPLSPKYISAVDSGNFVGYLYVLRAFLEELKNSHPDQKERIEALASQADRWITGTDFTPLYSKENRLLSIGYDVEENRLTDSYYDLLASEARQASLVAIAKKDIPQKHWQNLSKTLTVLDGYKGLISWSGTSFEYWMPNVNIPKYPLSLLDESCKFMVMSQQMYAHKLGIPWGISEAAFHLKDLYNNYQYKAFGIPWLGLKRGLADEMVVSSYGSILAVTDYPKEVVNNLKRLQECGMFQKYGYYEAVDFTPTRLRKNRAYELVKTYMAHHQGLILLSINNLFSNNILQKRMMANPEIQSVKILLQERMPEEVVITKEEKEKVEKMKPVDYDAYSERTYLTCNPNRNLSNTIANQAYTIVTNQTGTGYSKYKDIQINRYQETDEENQGIFFYLKNEKRKKTWSSAILPQIALPDKVKITFFPDGDKWMRTDGNLETTLRIGIDPSEPIEIRRLEVTNHGTQTETLEVTGFFEPILSTAKQDQAHKAFNNLFLRYQYQEEMETLVLERKARQESEASVKLAAMLFTEAPCIGKLEFEIDKEKFFGRGNLGIPRAVQESKALESQVGYTVDPIVVNTENLDARYSIVGTDGLNTHGGCDVGQGFYVFFNPITDIVPGTQCKIDSFHLLDLATQSDGGLDAREGEKSIKITFTATNATPAEFTVLFDNMNDMDHLTASMPYYWLTPTGDVEISVKDVEILDAPTLSEGDISVKTATAGKFASGDKLVIRLPGDANFEDLDRYHDVGWKRFEFVDGTKMAIDKTSGTVVTDSIDGERYFQIDITGPTASETVKMTIKPGALHFGGSDWTSCNTETYVITLSLDASNTPTITF